MRTQKGITLVALVITIIVLLILAGVSISMALGENGILTRAENSVEESDIASEMEKIRLAMYAYELDRHQAVPEYADMADAIVAETDMTIVSETTDTVVVKGTKGEYTVNISTGRIDGPNGLFLEGSTSETTTTPPTTDGNTTGGTSDGNTIDNTTTGS